MQYFGILVITLIFVFILFHAIKRSQNIDSLPPIPKILSNHNSFSDSNTHGINGTTLVSDMYIDQLCFDRDGHERTVKRFPVRIANIPREGFMISGCNHKEGNAILEKTHEAETVSKHHIAIGHDEQGFFAADNNSANKTFLLSKDGKKTQEVRQFDIEDGTVVCLGSQWIRFSVNRGKSIPSAFASRPQDNEGEASTRTYGRATVTENPPTFKRN